MKGAKDIGRAMIAATNELYIQRKDWAEERSGKQLQFKASIGSGKATYHQSDGTNRIKIIYGIEMIQDKLCPEHARTWLTYKELAEFGFCIKDQISPLKLYTHTVLHEFGHLVQVILGARYSRSVHNKEFYQILKKAYRNNVDKQVEAKILASIDNQWLVEKICEPLVMGPLTQRREVRLNQTVRFDFEGIEIVGIVRKKNPKTCVVESASCGIYRSFNFRYESLRVQKIFL